MKSLINVFVDPQKVFEEERKPWVPLIVSILIALVYFILIQTTLRQEILAKSLEYISNLPEEQKQRAMAALHSNTRLIAGLITIILMIPIKVLILGFIYNASVPIFGGEITFLKSFTVVAFANFVSSLSAIVKMPIALFTRNPIVRTDLGILFGELKGYLPAVLSQVDIFTIWSLLILAIGLEKYGKIKRSNAYLLVAIFWITYIFLIYPLLVARRMV